MVIKAAGQERWRENNKVVFIMMLVLIEQHVKCVMMNKGHKMMPYKKNSYQFLVILISSSELASNYKL